MSKKFNLFSSGGKAVELENVFLFRYALILREFAICWDIISFRFWSLAERRDIAVLFWILSSVSVGFFNLPLLPPKIKNFAKKMKGVRNDTVNKVWEKNASKIY